MNTTDMQRVLHGLRPDTHRYHQLPRGLIHVRCQHCIEDDERRGPLAALLRPFNDSWGNLDFELLMPELAMALDPRFGAPQIIQEIFTKA